MELWPLPGFDEREDAMVDLWWGGHQGGTVAGHPVGQQPCKGGGGGALPQPPVEDLKQVYKKTANLFYKIEIKAIKILTNNIGPGLRQ